MNPQIRSEEIGIRELEQLTLYPLSIADQLKMTDLITGAIQKFFNPDSSRDQTDKKGANLPEQMKDVEFIAFVVELIKENMVQILTLLTDHTTEAKAKKLLEKMTNEQLDNIIGVILEVNYQDKLKNVMSLFKNVMGKIESATLENPELQSQDLKGLSPLSSNDMDDTDSNTFSDSLSVTEA
jgi:lipopolysaccharide biosynthesis protein